jgi:uncharacterized protein YecE (DUF72 family)
MEFGKTPFFKEVDFSLPKERHNFNFCSSEMRVNLFLGTPQWNQKEWVGRIYPKGTRGSDTLRLYSERFNGIELNSTHYALPSKERIDVWRDCTTEGFKFSPKVSQRISHYGLHNIKSELDLFIKTVMGFEQKLGLSFMQLPPEFSVSDYSQLKNFLDLLPRGFELALEFRNPSFFTHGMLQNKTFDLLSSKEITTVITDTAGRRDVVHSSLTSNKVALRFVGNDNDESDLKRLDDWIMRIDSWYQQGLEDCYFFAHAPDNICSIDLASHFARKINSELGAGVLDPLEKQLDSVKQTDLFSL